MQFLGVGAVFIGSIDSGSRKLLHSGSMNSLSKLLTSIATFIASIAFAWIALTITGMIPGHVVLLGCRGAFTLSSDQTGFQITHRP
jgi:hypothetical protein